MDKYELERIYDLYFEIVYRICFLYMKNPADAQDVTQETFCQLIRKTPVFESDEKIKAWLIVCASNLCKNQLKKWWVRKIVAYEDVIGDFREEMSGADSYISDVYRIVMSLDEKYAIPTYLYYYEGYNTVEIARILSINQSTVQTRLAKARKLLRIELEE